MSCEKFDPKCPSCRPVLINQFTGRPLPPDDPATVAVNAAWDAAPAEEQEAFWHCTVKSSKDPAHLKLMHRFMAKVQSLSAN